MNRRIRIAQIGTGHDHAPYTYGSMCKLVDCFDVIGIAEPTPALRAGIHSNPYYTNAPIYDVEELLACGELDAVAIETEEEHATYYAQKFAEKGVAVHLDKPGTANLQSFEQLIHTLKAAGTPLQMGYMYRYNSLLCEMIDRVRLGEIGEVYSVEAHMSIHHSAEKRKWLSRYQGGMMYFLGCHLIDLILQIQGIPEKIYPLNACTGADGVSSEDYGFAVLQYPHGQSFVKTCAEEYNGFARRQLVICGTKGTIEVRPIELFVEHGNGMMKTVAYLTTDKQEDTPHWDRSVRIESEPFDRYDGMMREFAQIVAGEKQNPYSYDYELSLFQTLMACCESKESI